MPNQLYPAALYNRSTSYVSVEDGATKGATLDVNLYDSNGNIVSTSFVDAAAAIAAHVADPNPHPQYLTEAEANALYPTLAMHNTKAPIASPTFTGTVTTPALVVNNHAHAGTLSVGTTTSTAFGAKATIHSAAGTQSFLNLWQSGVGTGGIGFLASSPTMRIVNSYADGTLANGVGIDIDTTGRVGINGAPGASGFYQLKVYGGIQSAGANSQLQFEDRTTGAVYAMYANAGSMRIFNGTADMINITSGGTVTLTSSLTVPQTVTSSGTNAGYFFTNRTGTARTYGWYGDGNIVRLNVSTIGDVFTITEGGILGGPGVSESVVGSTVVKRNPSGYVFGNYFNMTANDIGTATAATMAVGTGGDGYLRYQSPTNFLYYTAATIDVRFRDVRASRGDGTGVIFLNNDNTRYLYYTGTYYQLRDAALQINGGPMLNQESGELRIEGTFRSYTPPKYLAADSTAWMQQPRVFVQSADPGAKAADNDLWFW